MASPLFFHHFDTKQLLAVWWSTQQVKTNRVSNKKNLKKTSSRRALELSANVVHGPHNQLSYSTHKCILLIGSRLGIVKTANIPGNRVIVGATQVQQRFGARALWNILECQFYHLFNVDRILGHLQKPLPPHDLRVRTVVLEVQAARW